MVYVQYYEKGVVSGELLEACGDRSVVILDGRNSVETMHEDAKRFNGHRRPEYAAYRLMKGDTLSRSAPISAIIPL